MIGNAGLMIKIPNSMAKPKRKPRMQLCRRDKPMEVRGHPLANSTIHRALGNVMRTQLVENI
jgi:hypothetical protein